jgi:hypothetical protein
MSEDRPSASGNDKVWMTIIIVAGIIALACIIAVTAMSLAFITNAPW